MVYTLLLLFISLTTVMASVDEAIELYLMGDMNGSIAALESLLDGGSLSLDEEIRAHHRLGAAYYGIGRPDRTEESFYNVLLLDPYYDLGPWENPALKDILSSVRDQSMATVLVQGQPDGALVFMNGDYIGSTPYTRDNLLGGQTYSFTIVAEGYEAYTQSCTTLPGQTHTVQYSMAPVTVETAIASLDTASTVSPLDLTLTTDDQEDGTESTSAGTGTDIAEATSGDGESITTDQLTELLLGGVEMASLGDVGPLETADSHSESGSSVNVDRSSTTMGSTVSQIDTSVDGQARIVFTDVDLDSQNMSEVSTGSSYSSRTTEEILEVLSSKTGSVTFIYNKHLRSDPLLAGTVVIEFIIEPSGRVSDVSILESTTLNPAFDLELASAVGTWRFGAVDSNEGSLPVTYPFNFSR